MNGITVVIILLVPILFQVFMLQTKKDRRHKEIKEILKGIEDKIKN
ncbi:MAG: hypothetical protein KAU91_02380 [Candidatus Aminicenantes bacterium]|nr:hypothetical protein [Candidatus Aminicenantes bacterium]